jgi:hypothetical protein
MPLRRCFGSRQLEPTDVTSPGMRSRSATLGVVVTVLLLGSLLNAQSLADSAHQRRPGWQRDVAIDVTDPLLDVSAALLLDKPGDWIADLRSGDEAAPAPADGPPAVFVPSADHRATLLVTGDSLTNTLGPELVRRSAATGVVDPRDEVVYSSGLTRPDFFDWPKRLDSELATQPAVIVVFMVGANDGQPIETAQGWVAPDNPAWAAEYRGRVRATMEVLAARATTSYWVGQPITRSTTQAAITTVMNDIFRSEASLQPSIRFIDAWSVFVDDSGRYTDWLPDASGRLEQVRDVDGVHLTDAGAARLAEVVLDSIRLDWDLPR